MRMILLVAMLTGALAGGAADLFAPDRFTMMDIVPCMRGEETVAAADAAEFAERTGNAIVLYSLTLHPVGRPASAKVDDLVASYRAFAKALAGTKARPGILLQAILGHWPRTDKEIEPWQRTVNIDGDPVRFCPLDPAYRAYIRETAVKLAKERPCVILSDDDVRSFSPKAECFCPLHTAEYNRRTGKSLTPEAFRAYVKGLALGDPDHTAFADLQRDTIRGVCALIREGIDSVDPSIPAGVCMPGWAWERARVDGYARTMAAKGQAPFVRLANGQYLESSPKSDLHRNVLETQMMKRLLGDGTWALDEADTWPHNPYSKSAAAMHAKLVTSAFSGLKGAKLWFVNCHKEGRPVSRNYTDVLTAHRGYYDAIAKIASESRPDGVIVPCHAGFPFDPVADRRVTTAVDPDGWAQEVFGVFGVPFRGELDLGLDGLYAIAGAAAVRRFTDAEIRRLLARRILLDGDAAAALAKRGFADLIGVSVSEETPQYTGERDEATGDRIYVPMSSKVPVFKAREGAKTLSSLTWSAYPGAKDEQRVAPASTLFRNRLGGTVVCTAYHMHMGAAYRHSEGRRDWLARRLADLAGAPVDDLAHGAQNTLVQVRRGADGAGYVLYANLNFDPARSVRLDRASRPSSVEALAPDGTWGTVPWTWEAGVLEVAGPIPCYGERLLRIR